MHCPGMEELNQSNPEGIQQREWIMKSLAGLGWQIRQAQATLRGKRGPNHKVYLLPCVD